VALAVENDPSSGRGVHGNVRHGSCRLSFLVQPAPRTVQASHPFRDKRRRSSWPTSPQLRPPTAFSPIWNRSARSQHRKSTSATWSAGRRCWAAGLWPCSGCRAVRSAAWPWRRWAALGGAAVYRGATGHCNVYGALGVSTAEKRGPVTSVPAHHGVKVEESVTIDRSPEELYRVFRDFENLPQFMSHLESVRTTGPKTSHWIARGPLGKQFEWDAEIHTERPNELISWRSLPGSEVDTAGSVHFLPVRAGRGTEVKVVLKYDPPTGKMGAAVAKLFMQSPEAEIREDLRRFKQEMERGT